MSAQVNNMRSRSDNKRSKSMKMEEMMKQCCGEGGVPDFEKMKQFMESCGKNEFGEAEMEMMKQFCGKEGKLDPQHMKAMMEKCGCHVPSDT